MEIIEKEFLKPKEIATMFGVTQETLRNWRRQGILPYFRIKNTIRFSRADVMEWLNKSKGSEGCSDHTKE
ncbi:MAG: helix-turn-helix domain-containing protein [Thermodesulfobacteriota bacterium]|jgi:excisionase family DNA binding protein